MPAFTITVQDKEVRATLSALAARASNLQPVMQSIGEDIMERAKQRFTLSTGPDGKRWAANSRVTIERYIASKGGFGKKGITQKGAGLAMSKKPLIGHERDLSRQFFVRADSRSVTVGNTMIYAAMQQFGGSRAQFPNLWGDIPARPFLPVTAAGQLYPADKTQIIDALNRYLAGK